MFLNKKLKVYRKKIKEVNFLKVFQSTILFQNTLKIITPNYYISYSYNKRLYSKIRQPKGI